MEAIRSIHSWMDDYSTPRATRFFLLLFAVDCVFVLLHFLLLADSINHEILSLETDRGLAELYQYAKISSVVVLLLSVRMKTGVIGYSVWALLFLYLVADDAFSVHEVLGEHLAISLNFVPALGLRAVDFGELAISAIIFLLFLSILGWFYASGSDEFRKASRTLLVLLMALAFFGVFVDMLHVALMRLDWRLTFVLVVVEDGGELLVMSIIAWYVFVLNQRTQVTAAVPDAAA
jgi:hypothetical protein